MSGATNTLDTSFTEDSNAVNKKSTNSSTVKTPRTRAERKATEPPPSSTPIIIERSIAEELYRIRKQLASYNIRLESQNSRLDDLSALVKENFADLKSETNACSKSQAETQKTQQARDLFLKTKRTQRRPMDRFHHFYKHYVLNKCKADLFENFFWKRERNRWQNLHTKEVQV